MQTRIISRLFHVKIFTIIYIPNIYYSHFGVWSSDVRLLGPTYENKPFPYVNI